MDDENLNDNNQKNENQAQNAQQQIQDAAKGVKDGASLAKNAATGNVVGAAKDAVNLAKNKTVRKKIIRHAILQAIVPIILIILAGSMILGIFGAVGDFFTGIFTGIGDIGSSIIDSILDFFGINTDDGSIEIKDESIDSILNGISDLGISVEDLKLLGDYDEDATEEEKQEALRKYIRKFYEAQVVTETLNYNRGEAAGKTYGRVYVYRQNDDGTKTQLTHISYDDMMEYSSKTDDSSAEEARRYFSVDENGNLIYAGTTEVTVEKGDDLNNLSEDSDSSYSSTNIYSIDYKSAISQYTTKMNFLVYLTMVSQNPEFVSAVTDLIKDSRIEITIIDKINTDVSVETYNYTLYTRREYHYTYQGESHTGHETTHEDKTEYTRTTTESYIPSVKVTYAKTWYSEQTIEYERIRVLGETETYEKNASNDETLQDEPRLTGDETGTWKEDQVKSYRDTTKTSEINEVNRTDVDYSILGEKGDSEDGKETFIALMETEYRIPYSTREEAAGSNLVSGDDMLFMLLQTDSELEGMEEVMRRALAIYTGNSKKYGVDNLNDDLFAIRDFATAGSGNWSSLWDNSITKEEFIEIVENYVPPDATGNGGRSFRECYNKYFVANAENFYDICTENGMDPRFIFCIGIHESAYGTSNIANTKGNFFGWGAYDSSPGESAVTFYDMSEGIDAVSSGVAKYTTPGTWQYQRISENGYDPTTIDGIGSLYASDPDWATKVKKYMTLIFGCTGTSAGNSDIVTAAVSVHNYIRTNGYSYGQRGITVPNTSGRTVDCSSFVTWVLVEAGVDVFTPGMYQKVSAEDARAGDIVLYNGHVEIIAANPEGSRFLVYNAGSNSSINASGTSELPESSTGARDKTAAIAIYRIPE